MNRDKAQSLVYRVDHALRWTLRGGNNPADRGDVAGAVDALGEVLVELLRELSAPADHDCRVVVREDCRAAAQRLMDRSMGLTRSRRDSLFIIRNVLKRFCTEQVTPTCDGLRPDQFQAFITACDAL